MEVQPDFRELLQLFNAHQVEYVIVGAYAVGHHGAPRYTGDMDVHVRPDSQNAGRVLAALSDFGFGSVGLTMEDFSVPDRVVQLGYPPVRIALNTSISGVPWHDAIAGREAGVFGDVPAFYLGLKELIANKRAAGRLKDLADLEALGEPPAPRSAGSACST